MKKTISVPTWFAALIMVGMIFSTISTIRAAEPHRERCAEGPTMTGTVNPACPLVSRPRFRLR